MIHHLSGDRKSFIYHLDSASAILLELSLIVKPASHRICGKGLTIKAISSSYHLSRIKVISDIRNTDFHITGIMISLTKNIQLWSIYSIGSHIPVNICSFKSLSQFIDSAHLVHLPSGIYHTKMGGA